MLLPIPAGTSIRLERLSSDHVYGQVIGTVTTLVNPVPIPDLPQGFDQPLMTMIDWPPSFDLSIAPILVSLWDGPRYLGLAKLHADGLRRV